MDTFLPKGFEAGLTRSRTGRQTHAATLCVEADSVYYPVLRRWATGFAVSGGDVPALSGIVTLYDGNEHLGQCLITGKDEANGETLFKVKRASGVDYAAVPDIEADMRIAASS